jgi:hypothetical protein
MNGSANLEEGKLNLKTVNMQFLKLTLRGDQTHSSESSH